MTRLSDDPLHNWAVRLGINTTNSWKSIKGDLKKADVTKYFDCRITDEILREYYQRGDSEPIKKPSPISIGYIMDMLNCDSRMTIHVGDTLDDLGSSVKVIRTNPKNPEKIITVGACYGYEKKSVLKRGVEKNNKTYTFDYLIDKPSELIQIVKDLL